MSHTEDPQPFNEAQERVLRLVSAMISQEVVSFIYTDKDGVTSIRCIRVLGIDRCGNKAVVVRAYDQARSAPRSFAIERIENVTPGNAVALITLV